MVRKVTKTKKKSSASTNKSREKLKNTPFSSTTALKNASDEIRQRIWERLETAKLFNEMAQKPEYGFINEEFKEGLKCKYGNSQEHLVRVYSEGQGIEIDINKSLVEEVSTSSNFVETLIRSAGDTFSKSYYKSKGILPNEFSLEEVISAIQRNSKK